MDEELNYLSLFLPTVKIEQPQDNTQIATRQYVDKQKAPTIYKPIPVITQGRTTPKTEGEKYLSEQSRQMAEFKERQQKEAKKKVEALEKVNGFLDFLSPAKHYEQYTGENLNDAEELVVDVVADPANLITLGGAGLLKSVSKKALKEATEEAIEKASREAVEKSTNNAAQELAGKIGKQNALELHQARIKNGGWENMRQQGDLMGPSPNPIVLDVNRLDMATIGKLYEINSNDILKATAKVPNSNSLLYKQKLLDEVKGMVDGYGGAMSFIKKDGFPNGIILYTPKRINKHLYPALSHELDHAIHYPIEPLKGFDFSKLSNNLQKYFSSDGAAEISARGSQIKDWLGYAYPSQQITEEQLKNAAKNYISETGLDNNMTQFFKAITNYKDAADWLSRNSSIITFPVLSTGIGINLLSSPSGEKVKKID